MNKKVSIIVLCASIVLIALLPILPFFRWDLTAEKRFSIAPQSKLLVKNMRQPISIVAYSGGNVDANIARLNNALRELVDELNIYATSHITYKIVNPSDAISDIEREKNYYSLEQRGLRGMSIASRDVEGNITQSVVFPWAEVCTSNDTMAVCLLKPDGNRDGEQGINRAIENLEFEITDAIRILNKRTTDKIAFIEGHGELPEEEVYDISEALSRYFQIDRGQIGYDADILADYKAIIIAKPTEPFAENEKYIIDQYIMNGGKVVWLVDGVQMQEQALTDGNASMLLPLDVNLQDQLFRYGVRITNTVVQDAQCAYMPVNVAARGEEAQFEAMPWFYAPLLLTSPNSPITKGLMQVKADFASILDFTNNNDEKVSKEFLLVTSNATHVSQTPSIIDLPQVLKAAQNDEYWFTQYQPVAALLQGEFSSAFDSHSRPLPKGISNSLPHRNVSVPTRMLVVADGDIIRNDLEQTQQGWHVIPLGYDRTSRVTFGNRDFMLNAILYLTDDDNWMSLRNRQFKLRMLNKMAISAHRHFWQWSNVLVPVILLAIAGGIYIVIRRRKYGKPTE